MKDHYEIVVVGSGYGGAIAASRLARAGQEVCLLEQGKEFQPGEYPNTLLEATAEFQVSLPEVDVHLGSRTGLYDLHAGRDINVFKGCGLGGTSLVNANVSIKPDARVFSEYAWPAVFKSEAGRAISPLWDAYERAFQMLGANPYPTDPGDLDKLTALEESAKRIGAAGNFHRTNINVTFENKISSGGVQQAPCTRCGDCVSGCNYGAKNTTLMNYLPDAVRHGAVIFTKCSVRYVERDGDCWAIWYQRLDSGHEALDSEATRLTADIVVLSGGTLGSTEILLRSKNRGLALSNEVGKGFSGNGDVLGLGYDLNPEINGMGWGGVSPGRLPLVGPCITGIIDLRSGAAPLVDGMIIEEGSIPGAVTTFMPEVLTALSRISGQSLAGQGSRTLDALESIALGPHHGALQHTQIYLVMAHDGGDGVMSLGTNDQLEINWPGVGGRPIFASINQNLKATTGQPVGGVFVENPLWAVDLLSKNLTTVHPLGGCRMSDSASDGVVNSNGQVFSSTTGDSVYDSLYVMDGAVVPSPLGVNPLLTISALTERAVANLAAARGWTIDYQSAPVLAEAPRAIGADFREQWSGTWNDGSQLTLALVVTARDLDALLNDVAYRAEVQGSAAISRGTQTETFAVIGTLRIGPGEVAYELQLKTDVVSNSLWARRTVPETEQPGLFGTTTSLEVRATENDALIGTVHCEPAGVLNELGTIRIYNARDESDRLNLTDSLSRRLMGPLAEVYGTVATRPSVLAPKAAPRKLRTLLAPAPEVDYFQASDGCLLRLIRYPASGCPPVLLVHGLGQSSRLFSVGALLPNLVEFLIRFGLDVWLLDDRGSIDLPEALRPFNFDQIAALDLPESIERIRRATGADKVALLAHGWTAAAAWMLLFGPDSAGVASFVSSQVGPIVDVPAAGALVSRLRTCDLWCRLGVSVLGGYDAQPGVAARLWNALISRGGSSDGAVVRRIEALYGKAFVKSNLSKRTKAALVDLCGPVSLAAGQHVQAIARAGRLVSAAGEDRYLSGAQLPNIPILLLHGSANGVSLPSGAWKSLTWLRSKHPSGQFEVTVINGFGQDDSLLGQLSPVEVFPAIARHLEAFRRGSS
jgi:cholesterol oxidase